jgi:site-specific DNA-methyltransferase (adenine-specific)
MKELLALNRIKMDLRNCDCMDLMQEFPDKHFQLAIVDPPYGIGIANNSFRQMQKKKDWDSGVPDNKYFQELFRVSQNQIIWGGNYFDLKPSQGYIIWDKIQPQSFSSSMCEMAWMSFQSPAKIFRLHVVTAETNKIHPTQKPVALYKWLLQNYAKKGDKILDTHLGSMSSVIACYDEKFDITGSELDPDYFNAGMERVKKHTSQVRLDDLI